MYKTVFRSQPTLKELPFFTNSLSHIVRLIHNTYYYFKSSYINKQYPFTLEPLNDILNASVIVHFLIIDESMLTFYLD